MKTALLLNVMLMLSYAGNSMCETTDPLAMFFDNRAIGDGCELLTFDFDLSGDGKNEVFIGTTDVMPYGDDLIWHVYSPIANGYKMVTKGRHGLIAFNPRAAFVKDLNGSPAIISAFSSGRAGTSYHVFQIKDEKLVQTSLKKLAPTESDAQVKNEFNTLREKSVKLQIKRTGIREMGKKYHFSLYNPARQPLTEADYEEVGPGIPRKGTEPGTPPPIPQPPTSDQFTNTRTDVVSTATKTAE